MGVPLLPASGIEEEAVLVLVPFEAAAPAGKGRRVPFARPLPLSSGAAVVAAVVVDGCGVVAVVWTSSGSGNGVSGRTITGGVGCSVDIPAWIKRCAADDDKGVRGSSSSSVCMGDAWVMRWWRGKATVEVLLRAWWRKKSWRVDGTALNACQQCITQIHPAAS